MKLKNLIAAKLIASGAMGASTARHWGPGHSLCIAMYRLQWLEFTYSSSGDSIIATGFASHTLATTTNLFRKNFWRRIASDPTGDHESGALLLICIGGANKYVGLSFTLGSTTGTGKCGGSDSATASGTGLAAFSLIEINTVRESGHGPGFSRWEAAKLFFDRPFGPTPSGTESTEWNMPRCPMVEIRIVDLR